MTILSRRKIEIIEGKEWTRLSRKAVKEAITTDSRVKRYERSRKYYKAELDKEEFLSLIFLDSKKLTGFLTHGYDDRTIRGVAERMVIGGYTFLSLIKEHGLKWYDGCLKIESDGFDYKKFGTIWLVMAKDDEKCKAPPSAKYYIYEGCHRSLVLGKLLLEGFEYQPVKAILIVLRPEN